MSKSNQFSITRRLSRLARGARNRITRYLRTLTTARETLVGLSLTESQLEPYAFRTVLRAIGNSEPLRQRVLDAHKLRQVREQASE